MCVDIYVCVCKCIYILKFYTRILFLGVSLDITHYNALLRVYLENEYDFSPTEFLADLEKRGIEPNRVTYQRLISKYCHSGNITGATRILEVMREKETPVNENIFNSLILGHSRAKYVSLFFAINRLVLHLSK